MSANDFEAIVQRHMQGDLQEAERGYRALMAQGFNAPAVLQNLAILLQQQTRNDEAIAVLRDIVRATPEVARAHYDLGIALAMQGQPHLPEAIACFRSTLAFDSNHHLAHFNLGVALQAQGNADGAVAAYLSCLRLQPDFRQVHRHLAVSLYEQGRLSEAVTAAKRAVETVTHDHEACLLLGRLLFLNGQYKASVDVLNRGLQIQPNDAHLHTILGEALRGDDRYDDAIAAFQRAIALDPGAYVARSDLGATYLDQGRIPKAVEALQSAIALQPQEGMAASNFIYTISTTQFFPPEEILRQTRSLDAVTPAPFPRRISNAGEKTRLAFASAEIGNHAVSYFLETYLRHYDRDRIHLSLYSTVPRPEPRTDMLMDLADVARDVSDMSDADLRRQIIDDGIDILIDTTSHMTGSRLKMLAQRCAPVQCHYIGFNGSTGVAAIDYFIGDAEVTPPEFTSHYSEKIIRLPRIWMAYTPPPDAPEPKPRPMSDALTLGCFNNLTKVRAETLSVWAEVMNAVPHARLLLKDRMCADPYSRTRITDFLAGRGIDTDRIEFLARTPGWREHMDLYNRVDIALDTLPLNSGTTGFDALFMATPLVALRGGWMGARMSSAMLKAIGHPEWIAENAVDYARIVQTLAGDRQRLAAYKQTLREEMLRSPLCDGNALARDLEAAFAQMLDERAAAG